MQELSEHLRSILLPPNSVSVPAAEDGFVSLRQQSGLSGEDEMQVPTTENWRNKAIRRKLSKMKELILFIGGLPTNFEKSVYVDHVSLYMTKKDDTTIGPIFPTQGCLFINFSSGMAAACMLKLLHDRKIFSRTPVLIFLPFINMPPASHNYDPLLVFINSKSGGGQGKQVLSMMKGVLNKNQVFLLEEGGPIPGLYAFRKLHHFRILVCGGDGTVGWVLSALEQVHKHVSCKCPPIAVLPLGTGNDLARVLGFGSGWNGEGVGSILSQVQEAQPLHMDRWTIFFDSSPQVSLVHNQQHNTQPDPQEVGSQNEKNESNSIKTSEMRKVENLSLINGHRKLQRTSKIDARRNPEWKKADMFNSPPSTPDNANTFTRALSNGEVPESVNSFETTVADCFDFTPHSIYEEGLPQTELEKHHSSISRILDSVGQKNGQTKSTHSDTASSDSNEIVAKGQNEDSERGMNSTSMEKIESPAVCKEGAEEAYQRKSLHRKLRILSESDVLENDVLFGPFAQFNHQISKCESLSSDDDPGKDMDFTENTFIMDDLILNQGGVEEILKAELPAIVNDKHKLITLLASVNMEDQKLDEILHATEAEESKSLPLMEDIRSHRLHAEHGSIATDSTTEGAQHEIVSSKCRTAVTEEDDNEPSIDLETERSNLLQMKHRAMSDVSQMAKFTGYQKKMSLPLTSETLSFPMPDVPDSISEEKELPSSGASPEPKVVTMNNYFGLGIDAEVSLAFHLAREENPERFSSRLHNKAIYLKAGLKKMTSRSTQLNSVIHLEVDGVKVTLPSIKGLILLNISSWGAGANAWGSGVSRRFQSPAMGDGLLEVVGISGVAHMSQIYSGIRNGFRIAQGEYVRLHLNSEVAVQVDGEPWMQPPGQIVITVSALQAVMLKRQKKKTK